MLTLQLIAFLAIVVGALNLLDIRFADLLKKLLTAPKVSKTRLQPHQVKRKISSNVSSKKFPKSCA